MSGSASQTSSIFNPGSPNKRWLTPGSTPPGWVSPGPPCTITNSHGTVAVFVEIDGVKREGIVNEDCSGSYDAINGGTSNGGSYSIRLSTFTTQELFRTILLHAQALLTIPVMVRFIRRLIMIGRPHTTVDPPRLVAMLRWVLRLQPRRS